MINLNNKKFKAVANTENGDIPNDFIFHYKQEGNVLTCSYKCDNIVKGNLIGIVMDNDTIEMSYHQINKQGEIKTGICTSKIIKLDNGKIRIEESWQWTNGDKSKGSSALEECD